MVGDRARNGLMFVGFAVEPEVLIGKFLRGCDRFGAAG